MGRESQYVESYLRAAAKYLWTPGTYLAYNLEGRAKDWAARYERALVRALERRQARGEVVAVRSAKGSVAYMRSSEREPPNV